MRPFGCDRDEYERGQRDHDLFRHEDYARSRHAHDNDCYFKGYDDAECEERRHRERLEEERAEEEARERAAERRRHDEQMEYEAYERARWETERQYPEPEPPPEAPAGGEGE